MLVNDVKKIAVIRANALGDFIVTLPALKALKACYPDAELVLLGKPWHREYLKNSRSPVDRVIIMPVTKGLREEPGLTEDLEEVNSFISLLRKESFDIAIHFHGKGIAANPFISRIGARVTVGLKSEDAAPIDRFIPFFYYQSEVIRYLEVVALVGAYTKSLEPVIKVFQKDRHEALQVIQKEDIRRIIVIHPCGTDIRRMWSAENFASVADQLASRNYAIVFTGTAEESVVVEDIITKMHNKAINTCGKLSLSGLTGLMAESKLVISTDTGPLHLARAVNAKTVGIYWAPNLINWGPLSRTNHRPVVSWKMSCPQCGIIPNDPWPFEPHTEACRHLYSFTADITPEQVLKEAEELLNHSKIKEASDHIYTAI